ncbi:glycine cleavage system protein R [Aeromonas cavernicola]|uniref:Glycine cleavage system transcriptional repressor n=1 Tax=Aeromonas cavernicola TaxID=1006623 RepID=A0A2H9U5R6_9GAMM|nr:ACT domain-containing protein [Aeromonas cavernicola]PJG59308.1 glycine cleavage system transcriptional repressor [Aeromonas cavernicola]
MTHYLVVTAIGTDRPGIVNEVTRHVSACGCNIVDSRLGIFGNEFTFIMLLSGDWNSLMQLEISLPLRSQEWDLITMMKRTERHQSLHYDISASAEILIRDEPGIVSQCTQFFSANGWNIQAMQSMTLEKQPFNLLKMSFQLNLAQDGAIERSQMAFTTFCQGLGATSFEFIVNRKPT